MSWRDGTLHDVVAALPSFGERPAVLTLEGETVSSLSFAELAERVGRLSAGLRAQPGFAGAHAAILAPNGPDWIVACLAVIDAGGVAVPVDAKLDDESLAHVLADCAPRLIFAAGDAAERARRLAPAPFRLIALDAPSGEASGLETLTAEPGAPPPGPPERDPAAPAALFYTSGTTGPPKGVPLSHRNLLFELDRLRAIDLMAPGERLLLPLPLHHVYPFVVGMLTAFVYGVGLLLPQSLTGPHIQQAIRSGGAAAVLGVPRLYETLLSSVDARARAGGRIGYAAYRALRAVSLYARRRLSLRLGRVLFAPLHRRLGPDLRLLASGGAALAEETAWALEAHGWTVATGYGLSETAPLLTLVRPGNGRFDSAGKPLDGVAVRIAPLTASGDEGDAPPANGIGEIQVQGPNVFQGYLGLPDRTAAAFTADGWFRTEDRGWLDPEGYLHVAGRAATFVVTPAGENIALEELERAYEDHPAIREIGLFQRDGALKAVVAPEPPAVRAADADADAEALARTMREAVRERARTLPRFKHIDTLRVSRDALARTRLGKLRRDRLRQRFDALAAGAGEQDAGAPAAPMAIADMSGEDQALLDHPAARAAWEELAERRPDLRLAPDSHVALDLGIDSLEWITITLAIRARAGVELSEAATGRIETVRDLMREAVAEAGRAPLESATLAENPERFLTPDQTRWLEPLGPVATAAAWSLYHINRLTMRALFRLRATGLENLSPHAQVILTPNHASVLDPFALAAAAPYPILKRSAFAGWTGMAFANPLTRAVARLGGTFPVAHERAAFSSLALALVTLRRGKSLIWFPEGRRSRDGALQPFLPGIAVLLQTHPTPVVPAVIEGAFEAMPTGRRLPRPGPIRVHFGKPVTPDALEAAGAGETPKARLVDGLQREVARLQAELRAR
ncbi:MAG: AMP-binding protein [Alphaproteobacteria bacterium]|nr:AMP-binding protein [Alphaproteobacteria bacterium]